MSKTFGELQRKYPALPRSFYDRPPEMVAAELLGRLMIRTSSEGNCVGRILETEAYLYEGDPACHAHRGQTRRNASMFGPPGHAYVYMIHAKWCFNVVTEAEQRGSAVLIRALEPIEGIELMQQRRGKTALRDLARGPARLAQALAITRQFDGWDLTRTDSLWIAADPEYNRESGASPAVYAGPRIGISQGTELALRFYYANNPFVSGSSRLNQPT